MTEEVIHAAHNVGCLAGTHVMGHEPSKEQPLRQIVLKQRVKAKGRDFANQMKTRVSLIALKRLAGERRADG